MRFYDLLSAALLIAGVQAIPTSDLANSLRYERKNTKACPKYCGGTNFNASLVKDYICGDFRLGPTRLPTRLPIFDLIDDYDRFGGLCPGEFLAKWYDNTSKSYIYPALNGFQLDTAGTPIQGTIQFAVGFLIDRFGSEFGTFVSPEGAPYNQRALPPSNLNTPPGDPRYPANYHVYRIAKPFTALSGPIAGWFGQPGQGVQYQLSSNIMTLLSGGFITTVNLKELRN